MKKEIIKGFGDIVTDMARGAGGKSSTKNRNSGDGVENIADSIINTISGVLGGDTRGKSQGQGGCGGCGGGRRGGGGRGGGRL